MTVQIVPLFMISPICVDMVAWWQACVNMVALCSHHTWCTHKCLGLTIFIILFYSILDTMGEIRWFTRIFSFFFPTMSVFVNRPNFSQICLMCIRFSQYVGKHLNCICWGLFKVDDRFCIQSLSLAHTTMTSNVPNHFWNIKLMLSNASISCKD